MNSEERKDNGEDAGRESAETQNEFRRERNKSRRDPCAPKFFLDLKGVKEGFSETFLDSDDMVAEAFAVVVDADAFEEASAEGGVSLYTSYEFSLGASASAYASESLLESCEFRETEPLADVEESTVVSSELVVSGKYPNHANADNTWRPST